MNIEIERKFLVVNKSFKEFATSQSYLKQGYLSLDKNRTVRVRIADEKAFLTIKGVSNESGLSRFEWEREISVDDAQNLMRLALPGIIEKTRFIVPYEGFIWEVDEFSGDNSGLLIAEIELPSEDTVFQSPSFIGDDVTGDSRYYNSYISQHPYNSWTDK